MKSSALIYIFIDDLGRTISFFFFWSLEIYTKIVCAILHDLHWGGGNPGNRSSYGSKQDQILHRLRIYLLHVLHLFLVHIPAVERGK